jgi:dUTP pyrophosphatase
MSVLYLYTSNPSQKATLTEVIASWRRTDSGVNLPLRATMVMPTKGVAQKLNSEIYGALLDANKVPTPFLILPRSSTGSKTPLRLANSVGLIDQGYRGELLVCADNLSDSAFIMKEGALLFQLCAPNFAPFSSIVLVNKLEDLPAPSDDRGAGGFGSTTA